MDERETHLERHRVFEIGKVRVLPLTQLTVKRLIYLEMIISASAIIFLFKPCLSSKFCPSAGGMHQTSGKLTLKQILFKYLDPSDHSWTHIQLIPTYLTGLLFLLLY